MGIIDRLGGRGGRPLLGLLSGDRCDDEEAPSSSPKRCPRDGCGIWLVVLPRDRGVAGIGMWLEDGVRAREGGRKEGTGRGGALDDWELETEDEMGDHGREDAMEVRERLRLYGKDWSLPYTPAEEGGLLGVPLMVAFLLSFSTFVELFHLALFGRVSEGVLLRDNESPLLPGEFSGARLYVCLWDGRSGVTGVVGWDGRKAWRRELRLLREGSEEGATRRDPLLLMERGVTGSKLFGDPDELFNDPDEVEPAILRANLRSGDIDLVNDFVLGPFERVLDGGDL